MAVAGNRVPPLQKRMVGNSGDVKGIKKKKKKSQRSHITDSWNIPGCQGDYLKEPLPGHCKTLKRMTGRRPAVVMED
jgi:hypothetical protein